jgi:hypothetical protein
MIRVLATVCLSSLALIAAEVSAPQIALGQGIAHRSRRR